MRGESRYLRTLPPWGQGEEERGEGESRKEERKKKKRRTKEEEKRRTRKRGNEGQRGTTRDEGQIESDQHFVSRSDSDLAAKQPNDDAAIEAIKKAKQISRFLTTSPDPANCRWSPKSGLQNPRAARD